MGEQKGKISKRAIQAEYEDLLEEVSEEELYGPAQNNSGPDLELKPKKHWARKRVFLIFGLLFALNLALFVFFRIQGIDPEGISLAEADRVLEQYVDEVSQDLDPLMRRFIEVSDSPTASESDRKAALDAIEKRDYPEEGDD